MPIYDIKCKSCGDVREEFQKADQEIMGKCKECGGERVRLVGAASFELKYDNKKDICGWAAHNYETSQYWTKVKEERAKGKDVKPLEE